MARANGTYQVELGSPKRLRAGILLISYDTRYRGDLEATSQGERLSINGEPSDGWVGYVMLEAVSGTLHGRRGSFVFQHSVTKRAEGKELFVEESTIVVPDSATGELKGLTGRILHWAGRGEYAYDFEYSLDSAP